MIIHFSFIFRKLLFWWVLSVAAASQPARAFMYNISFCFIYRLNFLLTFSSTKYLAYPSILEYLHVSIGLTSSLSSISIFFCGHWSSMSLKYIPGKSAATGSLVSIIEDLWTCPDDLELRVFIFFFLKTYIFDSFEYYTVRFDYVHLHNCFQIHPSQGTQVLFPPTF